jgi:hypothetical protein
MKIFTTILVGLLTGFTGLCRADVIYDVSLDTSQLQGNVYGPFALDFQLTSGDTTTGVVNVATLSQFHFGAGGSPGTGGGPFPNSGNASGSFSSVVSLSTMGGVFFNEFSGYFVPGDTLSFRLDLTNVPQPSATPDEFSFQLIDSSNNEVSTNDPSGGNSLLIVDLEGASTQSLIYTTNGDGATITPVLNSPASNVPEPGTAWLIGCASVTFFVLLRPGRGTVGEQTSCPKFEEAV